MASPATNRRFLTGPFFHSLREMNESLNATCEDINKEVEQVEHAAHVRFLAEHLGASARLDGDARVGRDLVQQGREIDAPAP